MKTKTEDKVKPWETISLDEILPYNPKYAKITILSYIFIAFFIFENTNFLGIQEDYLSLLTFFIYGITAFLLLYWDNNGLPKRMLKDFTGLVLVLSVLLVIGKVILSVIMGFNFLEFLKWFDSPLNIVEFVLGFITSIFVGINLFVGPINLAYMSNRPKVEKHGYILTAIFSISVILWILH